MSTAAASMSTAQQPPRRCVSTADAARNLRPGVASSVQAAYVLVMYILETKDGLRTRRGKTRPSRRKLIDRKIDRWGGI